MFKIKSVYDEDISGSKVLIRIDINSPIDPSTGKILDDYRIKIHSKSILELYNKDLAIVLMSHQGRPGDRDFIDLSQHAELLRKYTGLDIRYVDDVIGPTALKEIKDLRGGEIILLDNVRLLSEELIEAPPEVHARSFLVRRISPLIDYYINDAFATAHRSQPSIVGFPPVKKSFAGPIMYRELNALSKIMSSAEAPKIFVLGGAKIPDTLRVIENLVKKRVADRILTTGLVGILFQVAKGIKTSEHVIKILESRGFLSLVPRAKKILLSGAPIEIPIDYVVLRDDENISNDPVYKLSGRPMDIGEETIEMYTSIMKEASLIVLRGPAGYVEDERFVNGTKKLIETALSSKGYVIIGGGHLSIMIPEEKIVHEKIHVSTGGGALIEFLSGTTLPAVEALELSYRKFWGDEKI
jgi:phosphoglycerate kinase